MAEAVCNGGVDPPGEAETLLPGLPALRTGNRRREIICSFAKERIF